MKNDIIYLNNFNKTMNLTRRRKACKMFINCLKTTFLILFYYTCSIGLTFYQKSLIKDFKFPLTIVLIHLAIKFGLAGLCREIYYIFTSIPRVTLPWKVYIHRLLPPGVAAGFDISFSQWSLEFITITLYTMSKSTALVFILFFAILFKLEEMKWSVVVLVTLIAGGLIMFTYKYTQFNAFGFALVIAASILSGLRWTLSEIVMRKNELGLTNPIDMVYHVQPWMLISTMPLALYMEGESLAASEKGFRFHSISEVSFMWARIICGAVIAFLMEVSEYLVVSHASSLTLSISGVGKEVLTLSLAIYINQEQLSVINQLGLVCCVLGIMLHVVIKSLRNHSQNKTNSQHNSSARNSIDAVPLLNTAQDSDDNEVFSR